MTSPARFILILRPMFWARWTCEGAHLGNMQDIEATGRAIALKVMHLDRIVDGKLIEHRGLANEVDFMSQLGIELTP
jgi:predicted ester cyclase